MNTPTDIELSSDDFPALFRAADKASVLAQKQFARLTASYLTLMILAAIVGSIALSTPSGKTALALASAVFLTISAFLRISIKATRIERTWYDGRAIAESVKTLAWRYMTGAEPFTKNVPEADSRFISTLSSLINERPVLAAKLAGEFTLEQSITGKMKTTREYDAERRKAIYVSQRIDDQRRWYYKKAAVNARLAGRLFAGMVASQAAGVIFAFSVAVWPGSIVRATGIFTTLATTLLAWTQLRQNEQLAQSYGLAGQELDKIYQEAARVITDEQLSAYVANSENAISREHTMWLARRN